MILFTYVGGLLLAVGPSPWASGSCAPDAPYPPKVSPTPLALRPGPKPVRVRLPAL